MSHDPVCNINTFRQLLKTYPFSTAGVRCTFEVFTLMHNITFFLLAYLLTHLLTYFHPFCNHVNTY